MELNELLTNCNLILLPPSIHQAITKTKYDTEQEKIFVVWKAYFSEIWRMVAEQYQNNIKEQCLLLHSLAYEDDLYQYILKHKVCDNAAITSFKREWVCEGFKYLNNKIQIFFNKPFYDLMKFQYQKYCIELDNFEDISFLVWQRLFSSFWCKL